MAGSFSFNGLLVTWTTFKAYQWVIKNTKNVGTISRRDRNNLWPAFIQQCNTSLQLAFKTSKAMSFRIIHTVFTCSVLQSLSELRVVLLLLLLLLMRCNLGVLTTTFAKHFCRNGKIMNVIYFWAFWASRNRYQWHSIKEIPKDLKLFYY